MKDIFLSYSWANRAIADELDSRFKAIGITFTRDIRDFEYQDDLKDFMSRIRDAEFAFLIISESYLKSRNCMYEITELLKEEDYTEKIVTILLDDCKEIWKTEGQLKYVEYWENQYQELESLCKKHKPVDIIKQYEDLKKIEFIKASIGSILHDFANMKSLLYEEAKSENFKSILNHIGYDDGELLSNLARIDHIENRQLQDIEIEKVIQELGEKEEVSFTIASIAMKRNEFDKAKYYYEKALEGTTIKESIYNNLGIVYEEFNDYQNAEKCYKIAIEHSPLFINAYVNLALLYMKDHFRKYEETKRILGNILLISPYDKSVLYGLGILHFEKLKDSITAVGYFEKLVSIDPQDERSFQYLGRIYEGKPYLDYDNARKYYNESIRVNPNYAIGHSSFGLFLSQNRDYKGARFHLRKAIELDPNNPFHFNNYGNFLARTSPDKLDASRKMYEKAIKLNPSYLSAYNNLANLLRKKPFQDYDLSIEYINKGLEIDDRYVNFYLMHAEIERERKNFERAIEQYENALKIEPLNAYIYDRVSYMLFYDMKRIEEAVSYIRKAIELNPDNSDYYFNLGVMLSCEEMNDKAGAIEAYEKALEINPKNHMYQVNYENLIKLSQK